MYLFSYGANTNNSHLQQLINYKYVTNGILKNHKLVFNHLGVYGNIQKSINDSMVGTIIEIDEDNLEILNKKEFMYDVVKLNIIGEDYCNYNCLVYKSQIPIIEFGTLPYYKQMLIDGYSEHNLPIPEIETFNFNNKKIILLFILFCIIILILLCY